MQLSMADFGMVCPIIPNFQTQKHDQRKITTNAKTKGNAIVEFHDTNHDTATLFKTRDGFYNLWLNPVLYSFHQAGFYHQAGL